MAFLRKSYSSNLFSSKKQVPIQILSDLHLEVAQQYSLFTFPCAAKYLILAGDIGRLVPDYDAFLSFLADTCCNRFERVLLVLGNHEFYGGSHAQVLDTASKLESEPILGGRLTILYRRRIDLSDGITILGCTLHSHIPPGSAREAVQGRIKDFQRINGWTVDDHNAEHEADVRWLIEELEQIRRKENASGGQRQRIVVITHHAPCIQGTSDPQHANNPWNPAFATDLLPSAAMTESRISSSLLSNVRCWIFGHTHFTTDFKRYGLRLMSNQRGYVLPGMNSHTKHEIKAREGWTLQKSQFKKLLGLPASDQATQFGPDKVVLV